MDECSERENACGANEQCVNDQGKYSCQCQSGYMEKNGACVKKGKLLKKIHNFQSLSGGNKFCFKEILVEPLDEFTS